MIRTMLFKNFFKAQGNRRKKSEMGLCDDVSSIFSIAGKRSGKIGILIPVVYGDILTKVCFSSNVERTKKIPSLFGYIKFNINYA